MATIYDGLPPLSKETGIVLAHFPTPMQALVFRMWEMIPAERIALVLNTSTENVQKLAEDMGLPKQKNLEEWMQKGYISIIRAAWHIMPYNQLLKLLGWNREHLEYVLREDDFLGAKLGGNKPVCEEITYRPLNTEEKEKTAKIKADMEKYIRAYDDEEKAKPFDFFMQRPLPEWEKTELPVKLTDEWCIDDETKGSVFFAQIFTEEIQKNFGINIQKGKCNKTILLETKDFSDKKEEYHEIYIQTDKIRVIGQSDVGVLRGLTFLLDLAKNAGTASFKPCVYKRNPRFETRCIFSYCGLYCNAFDAPPEKSYPESILRQYALMGVNGIWNQAILYKMCHFPFAPEMSEGWEKRLSVLKDTVKLAEKYGIKLYLYLNEPRALPLRYFKDNEDVKGQADGEAACFCTSTNRVQEYIRNSIKTICKAVPSLGGIISITAAENWTTCFSRSFPGYVNCPHCIKRTAAEVTAELNNIMAEAAHSVNPGIKFFAWTWAWWSRHLQREGTDECIRLTDKDITVLCTSEEKMPVELEGSSGYTYDYTMSKGGPGERSLTSWKTARESGHRIAAKVQVNNTWECSSVPFIPVLSAVEEHIQGVIDAKNEDIMLGWTLGGYPSDNLKLVSGMFFDGDKVDMLRVLYGKYADSVKKAGKIFSDAFKYFPNSQGIIGTGPQNPGVANLLYEKLTGLSATMTCFSYDDVFKWSGFGLFPPQSFERMWSLLTEKWQKGLDILSQVPNCELKDCAEMVYIIYKSCLNQCKFIRLRNSGVKGEEICSILKDERELASNAYRIMLRNPCMGYEASNHYYYTRSSMMEKVINCTDLIEKFSL